MDERTSSALLRSHGLRVTPQRSVVVDALMTLSHPDAETVFRYVRRQRPTVSLATVYNALDKLREAGLVAMVEFHGRRHFDVRVEGHDHMRCRRCGELADVARHPGTLVEPPDAPGWLIEGQALVWEGLCAQCRRE